MDPDVQPHRGAAHASGRPDGSGRPPHGPWPKDRAAAIDPVAVAEIAGRLWLVAPFGASDWVHNLRASGRARIKSGLRSEEVTARELGPDETLAFFRDVLDPYVRANPVARWFVRKLDGLPEDPAEAAARSIVFEVTRLPR